MVKRLIPFIAFLASLLYISPLFAGEDWQPQVIGPFGNLNNRDSSYIIGADKAQDLLNVDITPGGKSVKKRKGFSLVSTLSISTSPVHGIYNFYDSNGSDVFLYFNDTRLTSSISGGTNSVLFSTGTNGATYQCVDSQGFAYCVDSSRGLIIKTNGQTYSLIAPTSNGSILAVTPERLVLAGFSGSPSRIDVSKASDFTTWTIGGLPTDPIQFTINAPGSKITHLTYAFNRIFWFKDSSFGYILSGPTQGDWVIKTISPNLGTLDNSSVYWEGLLYFRGQDGHIYSYDGANLSKLTRDIQTTISNSQIKRTNSWLVTTQADFGSGLSAPAIYLDTYTAVASIRTTFPDNFSSYRDGTSSTKKAWTYYESTVGTGSATTSNGYLNITHRGGTARACVFTAAPLGSFQQGTTYHIQVTSIPYDTGSTSRFYLVFTSYTAGTGILPDANPNSFWYLQFNSTIPGTAYLAQATNNTGDSVNAGTGTIVCPFTLDVWLATTSFAYTINGSSQIKAGSHTWPARQPYVYLCFTRSVSSGTLLLDDFGVAPATATFDTAVNNAANLTAWDTFVVTNENNGGSHSFYLRSSTNTFAINSSTPAWTAVTDGAVPTISTGTFFQARDYIATTSTSDAPQIDDIMLNFFEGSASDKAYGTYHRDAIWWSVTSGTGATTNNRIIRYDLINQGNTLYDIANNGMYVKNQALYFGSSSAGKIYKFGDIDNDDTSAINAYWTSKDFFGGNPFASDEIANISVVAASVANSSMTVTYITNGQTTNSFTMNLYNSTGTFVNKNKNMPAGLIGNTYSIRFGNNAADQPFEVFGVQVGLRPRSWVPTQ